MAKKKKAEQVVKPFEDVMDDINARLGGAAVIRPASECFGTYRLRRPTGLLSLDRGIGGGFAAGSINQLFGDPGTGKNYLCDQVFQQVQKNYGEEAKVFFASFGYRYDKVFGQLNGVSVAFTPEEIEEIQDDLAMHGGVMSKEAVKIYSTQLGHFYQVQLGPADVAVEKPAEVILSGVMELIKTGRFQVGVIDETNMGETQYGARTEVGDPTRTADFASLMNDFLKRFGSSLNAVLPGGKPNETTLIEILEVRSKISSTPVRYGVPKSQGGGWALKHWKAADVHMRPGQRVEENKRQVGKEIHWRVAKAKLGAHEGAEGTFLYRFGLGIDMELDLLRTAVVTETVTRKGAWYYFGEERLGHGESAVAAKMKQDEELCNVLRVAVLKSSDISMKVT